jgi:hypothetical protein
VFHIQIPFCIVDRAVLIVVVTHSAVQHVVLEDAIEGLTLGNIYDLILSLYLHSGDHPSRAGAGKLTVDLHDARITTFDRTHLRDIADLWDRLLSLCIPPPIQQIN